MDANAASAGSVLVLTIKDIALVLFGFILSESKDWLGRRRKLLGHWGALAAEAEACERLAGAYLEGDSPAPLYRLPEAAFSTSFPELLAEGTISRLEARQLTEFRGAVQEINRGLDRAGEALAQRDTKLLEVEAKRLNLKCQNLLHGRDSTLPNVNFIRQLLERRAGVKPEAVPQRAEVKPR